MEAVTGVDETELYYYLKLKSSNKIIAFCIKLLFVVQCDTQYLYRYFKVKTFISKINFKKIQTFINS